MASRARTTTDGAAADDDPDADGAAVGASVGGGLSDGPPKSKRSPGSPNPIALATAAIARTAMSARTSARRAGRQVQPRRAGGRPAAASIRDRTIEATSGASGAAVALGHARFAPRSRSAASRSASGRRCIGRSVIAGRPFDLGQHARSRPSAREVRDLTVPARSPSAWAVSASDSSSRYRAPITSRSSSRSRPMAAQRVPRRSSASTSASGDGALGGIGVTDPARTARSARRVADRRRLRLSFATMLSSHGRTGAPARKRGSAA